MKNGNGFTLIEAIVVSLIIAVLAAVAIPIYSGFVHDSRQDAVHNLLQTAIAAEKIYHAQNNLSYTTDITQLGITYDASNYSIAININASTGVYIITAKCLVDNTSESFSLP